MKVSSGRVAIFFGCVTLGWILGSRVLVPKLLQRAWAGEGPGFIGRLATRVIDDPQNFPARWTGYSWTVTWLIVAFGALIAAGTSPGFQAWLEARHGKATTPTPRRTLGRHRALLVQAVIGFVLGASLLSTVSAIEVWPFSPYRMYASTQASSFGLLRISGATESVSLDLGEVDDAPPFDRPRFQSGMRRLLHRHGDCAWFDGVARYAIRKFGELYPDEARRIGAFRAVRLDQLTWDLGRPALSRMPASEARVCQWTPPEEGR